MLFSLCLNLYPFVVDMLFVIMLYNLFFDSVRFLKYDSWRDGWLASQPSPLLHIVPPAQQLATVATIPLYDIFNICNPLRLALRGLSLQ
jgi:hypothetical protein